MATLKDMTGRYRLVLDIVVHSPRKSSREQVLDALDQEWQTTAAIRERFGRSRKYTSDVLNALAAEGKVDVRGPERGGATKVWRRHVGPGPV
jgi:hypothetical protein